MDEGQPSQAARIERAAPFLTCLAITCFLVLCSLTILSLSYRATLLVSWMRNEGWNAFHAHDFWAGLPIYHPATALITNNYPPLSFMATAAVMHLWPDAVFAGRLLASCGYVIIVLAIVLLVRRETVDTLAALFAAAIFTACLCVRAGSFVAADDPQLLAHAPSMLALLFLLRPRPSSMRVIGAAALFVISLFTKHNIIALPVAVFLYLCLRDSGRAALFAATGVLLSLAGLTLCYLAFGLDFFTSLLAPRQNSLQAMRSNAEAHLFPMTGLLVVVLLLPLAGPRGPLRRLALLYLGTALISGVGWSVGTGTGPNLYFDLYIATALAAGCLVARPGFTTTTCPHSFRLWAVLSLIAASLIGPGLITVKDALLLPGWASYYRQREADTRDLINSIASQPGRVLCETPLYCYWAGKTFEVDMFFFGQDLASGRKTDAVLRQRIADGDYSAVVLDSANDPTGMVRLLPPGAMAHAILPARPRLIDPVVVPLR